LVRYRPALILLAVSALLLAPSLVLGTMISHSSPQNLTWAEQFADQFRAGVLYPRWLPQSFDGLGSPTFYFYPPIAFWVDALLSVVTANLPSVSYRLSLATLVLLWASGLAMYAWLKAEGPSPRVALWGAVGYMAAPYHLLDHYYRGAFAELAAYVVLPLLALSIRRIAEGRRWAPVLFALAYAALPMSHLPTALLISLTVLPLYVLYRGWRLGTPRRALGFFVQCGLGGVLGLGVAAIYLVPALGLQSWIPVDTFWISYYHVDRWFLLSPARWPQPIDMMLVIAWSAAAYAIAAIGVLVVLVRGSVAQGWRSETAFWTGAGIVCLLLIAGIPPWFWQLPFVAKVQFPWRLMVAVEFAVITALCLMPWPVRFRVASYVFVAAVLALIPAVVATARGISDRAVASAAQHEVPADLKQFEPAGFPQDPKGGYADLGLEPLKGVPDIVCRPEPRTCRVAATMYDELQIDVDADTPTEVVLRRFYYPLWRLDPPLPAVATDPLQLVAFTAPAGRHTFRLQRAAPPEERIGRVISGLSLVLLLAWAALASTSGRLYARYKSLVGG
jgi:hypothetical protein